MSDETGIRFTPAPPHAWLCGLDCDPRIAELEARLAISDQQVDVLSARVDIIGEHVAELGEQVTRLIEQNEVIADIFARGGVTRCSNRPSTQRPCP